MESSIRNKNNELGKRGPEIASKTEMSLVAEEKIRCFVLIVHVQSSHHDFQAVMLLQLYCFCFLLPTFNADESLDCPDCSILRPSTA